MIAVIENVEVYSPKYLGKKTVVVVGDKFEGIYDEINIPDNFISINRIDGSGKLMVPGFIDSHVHIIGGGGETGFNTRTPEIGFSDLTKAGITTVVGCLGTDDVARDGRALIAKANSIEVNGLTSYCYTGSYSIPVKTVTGSIKEDMMMIDKYIGVGEIAVSDNRSAQPTFDEFARAVAQARVGGLLSGKSGIVNVHIGSGERKLEMLFNLLNKTEIPATQILPTHVNRTKDLFEEGIEYMKMGGYVDFTTSSDPDFLEEGEISASEALKKIVDFRLPIEQVTFSSDGNGSMPNFDKGGNLTGMGICSVESLYREVRRAILEQNIPIEIALTVITSNVAKVLKLKDKGEIQSEKDADFVLINKEDLTINDVYAKGRALVINKEAIKKGMFE